MKKGFWSLFLAVCLLVLLSACNNSSTPTNNNTSAPAADPAALAVINNAEPKDVTLFDDVPLYPGMQLKEKKSQGSYKIISFKTDAKMSEIVAFYEKEMSKNQWKVILQPTNAKDGYLYSKDDRTFRMIPVDLKENGREVYMFLLKQPPIEQKQNVQAKTPDGKEDENMKYLGNLMEDLQMTDLRPLPVYPNAEAKISAKPGKWREFDSKDSVNAIESWYSQKLKESGWEDYHNTSENGDSMRIYTKKDEKNNVMYVGVRINDKKDHRRLSLVSYAMNATMPKLLPPSKLAEEQKEAYAAIKEQMEKVKAEKARAGIKEPEAPKVVDPNVRLQELKKKQDENIKKQ